MFLRFSIKDVSSKRFFFFKKKKLFNPCFFFFQKNFEGFVEGFFSLSRVLFLSRVFHFFNGFLKMAFFSEESKRFSFLFSFFSRQIVKSFSYVFQGFCFFLEGGERRKRVEERVFLPFSNVFLQRFFFYFFFFFFLRIGFVFSQVFFFQRVLSFRTTFSKFFFLFDFFGFFFFQRCFFTPFFQRRFLLQTDTFSKEFLFSTVFF